jgi:DNA-binding NarL/FixJ family response regulator
MNMNAKKFIPAIDPLPTPAGRLLVAGMLSGQRPTSFNPAAAKASLAGPAPKPAPTNQPPQLFHNSYTRGDRRFLVKEWALKIQHEGQLRVFSLRGKTKPEAALEARSIWDTIVADGWEAALGHHPDQGQRGELFPKTDARFWRQRLLPRNFRFFPAGESQKHFAAHIDYAGTGCFFPLGASEATAAANAAKIYQALVERGWDFVCRRFSREMTVGFAWCSNPFLWTYATIHTLVAPSRHALPPRAAHAQRVLILESDAGIGRALAWCVDQQAGLCSVACASEKSFEKAFDTHQPALVLLNRNMAARIGWESPGQVATFRNGVPALAYGCSSDANGLFTVEDASTRGCLLIGVKPEHLLKPIPLQAGRPGFSADDILARVRALYKNLFQARSGRDTSALATLTPRERRVLALVSEGRVDKEIAAALVMSVWTVHGHIKRSFARLRVRTRTEAAVRYLAE